MTIVLQARLRSSRLPAKGYLPFFGQTVWERMCDIALAVRGVDEVIFATGDASGNELARAMVEAKGARFFSGSEDNVLARFCCAVAHSKAGYIIRLTCDNYLAQPDVIEGLAAAARDADADYAHVAPLTHFGGEVIRLELLLDHWRSGKYSAKAAEHVTYDIRETLPCRKLALPSDYLGLDHANSPTLDSIDDFVLMKRLEEGHHGLRPVRCLSAARQIFPAS